MATNYPSPGRGAWTRTGGLLPGRPGGTGRTGYYRMAVSPEAPVGSTWLMKTDLSHHAYVVQLGVKAIQRLIKAEVDGWLGEESDAKIREAQRRLAVDVDGIVGRDTMRALLDVPVNQIALVAGVPVPVLGGILAHESHLDPGAVGVSGADHGLAQINLAAHEVTEEQACDPDFALHWTADDLKEAHDIWKGRTKADPWDIAIAHHNSPLLAKKWAIAGKPPVVEGRKFQIAQYVQWVRDAWQ